jgi:ACS family glucarate transporter-like MFS transporter
LKRLANFTCEPDPRTIKPSTISKRILLALLVLLSIITFLDRLCIAAAGPRIQQDLGITPEQWGWVLGAFVLSYGLFEIPTGALGDRFGQRRVLTRIVLWWSAFTALTGVASGFVPLVIIRFLFGAGEAGAYPNMAGVVSRWFLTRERAVAQGFIWGASRAGGALAPLLVIPIQSTLGWRASFFIFGAVGIVWCVIWLWWYRDGQDVVPVSAHGGSQSAVRHHEVPWGVLLRSPQVWTIVLMYGCYAWGSWFYFSWLHTWLVKARGFSEAEMAIFSALPFVLGAGANLAGGFVSDAAVRKLGVRRGRIIVGSTCLAIGACLLVATALTQNKTGAVFLLTLGFGVMDLMLPSAWAICLDISGPHAGAVTGAMNTAGQFGGFLCTVLFGYIVGQFNDYNLPLFVIAGMVALSAFLFTRIDASRPLTPVADSQPAIARAI